MKILIFMVLSGILLSCGKSRTRFREVIVTDDRLDYLCKRENATYLIGSYEAIIIMKEYHDEVFDEYGVGWMYEPYRMRYTNGHVFFAEYQLEDMEFYSCYPL